MTFDWSGRLYYSSSQIGKDSRLVASVVMLGLNPQVSKTALGGINILFLFKSFITSFLQLKNIFIAGCPVTVARNKEEMC